jgi:tRNA(Ile)-lysidine synthase
MICEQLRDSVRAGGLFARDRPVVAMLSGGRDSTCLLDVAVALLGPAAVSALHVNYGLRDDADVDERHCAALCELLGVELEVVRAAGDAQAPGNLQAWARDVRYAEAGRIARERDALIATGHTASDQVETILYRLAASPGRRALLGMVASEGRLIRPLLGVGREQTAAYCQARGLQWRDDESNEDERFARARVRHGLVPALRAVHPAAEANVLRTASLLREETELLDGLVAAELAGRASIGGARRPGRAGSRSRACRSCRPRSRGWSWCVWPRTQPVHTYRRRAIVSRSCSRLGGVAAGRSCTWAGTRAR